MRTQIRQSSRHGRLGYTVTVSGPEYAHVQRVTVSRIEYARALRELYKRQAGQMAITAFLSAIWNQN